MTNCLPDRDNRRLRRADFRFLLPDPAPSAAICLAGGELLDATTCVSPAVAVSFDSGPDQCDLVVARNPNAATLRAARSRLREGCACYAEFTGRRFSHAGVQQAMTDAGFHDVRTYRRWPSDESCQVWLPDQPSWVGSAYFNRDAADSDPRAVRAIRRMRRSVSVWCRQRGAPSTVCAVGLANAVDAPAQPPLVLQTSGSRGSNKVVTYLFDAERRQPSSVLKTARAEDAARGLCNEATILEALHQLADVPPGIPRVLFRRGSGAALVVAESAAVGRHLPLPHGERPYRLIARAATTWAIRLAAASRGGPLAWPDLVEDAVREFEAGFGAAIDRTLVPLIRQRLAAVQSLPRVCEHRDLAPWNIMLGPAGDIIAYDWESAVWDGVPALDLIYLLSYLAAWRGGLSVESYRRAWSGSTWAGQINRECLAIYAAEIGLEAETIDALRLLTWIVHARSEWRRLREDCGGVPDAAALRGGVFLPLIDCEAGGR